MLLPKMGYLPRHDMPRILSTTTCSNVTVKEEPIDEYGSASNMEAPTIDGIQDYNDMTKPSASAEPRRTGLRRKTGRASLEEYDSDVSWSPDETCTSSSSEPSDGENMMDIRKEFLTLTESSDKLKVPKEKKMRPASMFKRGRKRAQSSSIPAFKKIEPTNLVSIILL